MKNSDLIAYILAGGGSRRMGVDKLFLPVGGLSLLERTVGICQTSFQRVKLVARRSEKLLSLGLPVVIDSPEASGPMAGIIAALEDCPADMCFVTAADLYDLSGEIIGLLISNFNNQQYLGVTEANGVQPLCGIYHKSSLGILYRFARQGNFRMTEAVQSLDHSGIDVPVEKWRNVNCPADIPAGEGNG